MVGRLVRDPLPITRGGTGSRTATASFNALSPLTTLGDILSNDGTNDVRVAVGAADTFLGSTGAAVPSWRTAAQVLASLNIVTDTYTPTLFNTTNLDGSTASTDRYLRVDDYVLVWGNVAADATAAASTATLLGMSLPIASDLTSFNQLAGLAAMHTTTPTLIRITGDAANNRASFDWASSTTANANIAFIFAYPILA